MTDKTGDFTAESVDKGHARIEKCQYYYCEDISWLEQKNEWEGIQGIGMVIRRSKKKDRESVDTRYYISNIEKDIKLFAKAVRKHGE